MLDAWQQYKIPLNHRTKYIQVIQELSFKKMVEILQSELKKQQIQKSQISQVLKYINLRENAISEMH